MGIGRLRAMVCLVGVLGSGCSNTLREELPPVTQMGKRVAFAAPELELCAGTLAALDTHIARLEATLALERPGKALVYVLEDAAQVAEICGGQQRGRCYDWALRASVIAREALVDGAIEHELVHDFADHTKIGALPPLLAEGLATLLSWEWAPRTKPSTSEVTFLLNLGPNASLQNDEYVLGALFVNHLLSRFESDAVTDFFAALDQTSTSKEVGAAAQDHLSQSLTTLVGELEATTPLVLACTRCRESARAIDGEWSARAHFDCSLQDTLNDFDAMSALRVNEVIELERDSTFMLDASPDVAVSIASCDCEMPQSPTLMGVTSGARFTLSSGSHILHISGARELDGTSRTIALLSIED